MDPEVDGCANAIVAALPGGDRARLLARCETVELGLAQVLAEAGSRTQHVHFPIRSVVSLIVQVDAHPGIEVGMVGREGMLGGHVGSGLTHEPLTAVVQAAGPALRIARLPFCAELARSAALRRLLGRYACVLMAQRATAAGCLHYHAIGPRLARWLLMNQDRAGSDRLRVTQEVLACMLGVRRVGVTEAAGDLQRRGLIRYHRGDMRIVDRARLEAAACACYAEDKRIFAQVMGPAPAVADRLPRTAQASAAWQGASAPH